MCVHVCIYTEYVFFFFFIYCTTILAAISTGYGECLLDEPVGRTYELPTLLPGQIYNANRQCELMFGPGSQICPYMVSWLANKARKKNMLKNWNVKTEGVSESEMVVLFSGEPCFYEPADIKTEHFPRTSNICETLVGVSRVVFMTVVIYSGMHTCIHSKRHAKSLLLNAQPLIKTRCWDI